MIAASMMLGLVVSVKSLKGGEILTPVTGSENPTMKFTLVASVGFESARKMDKTLGERVTVEIYSYVPISGAEPLKPSLIPGIIAPRSIFELDESRVKLPVLRFVKPG